MPTFQQLIHRLEEFWEKQGCVIHLGHDLETGAGTFNPATFLRCLGPEPYHTAYVEPSRRPADGRYGKNPNRFQLFHQFQVILKPSPANIQQLFLDSLVAIGLNVKEHDIRFVHDDWESPTLGAWGLGWEVWIDGMEVTQFTYFQAIANLPLKPIPGEITYGLERLALFLQKVDTFFDVRWNETLTFRDLSLQNEVEWSIYNFEEASIEMWQRHFTDAEKEAKRLTALHLPIPAYDFVVKASHAFNMLEARGAISVTERTGYIGKIRDLARLIAMEYLASREKQGFPLVKTKSPAALASPEAISSEYQPDKDNEFLLEIGSEQLPATFVPVGCTNLEKGIRKFLAEHGLSFGNIHVYGTPRRLAVRVTGLPEGTKDQHLKRKGPAVTAAFQKNGQPSPQGMGFLKSLGHGEISLDDVRRGQVKDLEIHALQEVEYVFASISQKGVSTIALLAGKLPEMILNLDFPKKMRWGDLDISYPRPLHWMVALYGETVIPFQLGDLSSGRISQGHAQIDPRPISIAHPSAYLDALRAHRVMADIEARRHTILEQLADIEARLETRALEKEKVLAQVVHLTEWPLVTSGSYDPNFLKAPPEVLISEMVEHQKYFPLADASGTLRPLFAVVADNVPNQLIVQGNERVLSARLSDGVFLYEQDLKTPLEEGNGKLRTMVFQKELGSMFEKVERIMAHATVVSRHLAIGDQQKLARAALLCKADLASHLVGEFPHLQGTVGKYLAAAQKEDPEVALAIEEHWMPRFENAPLPTTPCGMLISLADKIDNLLSFFSIGLKPTSSSDPYALRRQTLGLIRILVQGEFSVNLLTILQECATAFARPISTDILDEVIAFLTGRAKTLFEESEFKKDEIDAVLRDYAVDPYDQYCKVKALHEFRRSQAAFPKLFEVYKRTRGQLESSAETVFDPTLATEPAETALVKALEALKKPLDAAFAERNYLRAFELLASLHIPLAHLFETVKILADDPKVRHNRIALLQKVFKPFSLLLDFSRLQSP